MRKIIWVIFFMAVPRNDCKIIRQVTTRECKPAANDIVFVLDRSVSETDFDASLYVLENQSELFHVGSNIEDSHIGMVLFDNVSVIYFDLGNYSTDADVAAAISSAPYGAGETRTNVSLAMNTAITQVFGMSGDRPEVRNMMVVITFQNDGSNVAEQHRLSLTKNITTFALGFEGANGIDATWLTQIAGYPQNAFVVTNIIDFVLALDDADTTIAPAPSSTVTNTATGKFKLEFASPHLGPTISIGSATTSLMTTTNANAPPQNSTSTNIIQPTTITECGAICDTLSHYENISSTDTNVTQILQNVSDIITNHIDTTVSPEQQEEDLPPLAISEIATILNNTAYRNNLTSDDFYLVNYILDQTLRTRIENFDVSHAQDNSTLPKLRGIFEPLIRNSPPNSTYTNGTNQAVISRVSGGGCDILGLQDVDGEFRPVTKTDSVSKDANSAISIHSDILCNSMDYRYYFTLFRNTKLFLGNSTIVYTENADLGTSEKDISSPRQSETSRENSCKNLMKVNSKSVLSAGAVSVFGGRHLSGRELTDELDMTTTLQFNTKDQLRPLHGKYAVTYWDEEKMTWSEDYCSTLKDDDTVFVANCTKIAESAFIVQGSTHDPMICTVILMILHYIVNVVSMITLLTMTVSYITRSKITPPSKCPNTIGVILKPITDCLNGFVAIVQKGLNFVLTPIVACIKKCHMDKIYKVLKKIIDILRGNVKSKIKIVETCRKSVHLIFAILFAFFMGVVTSGPGCEVVAAIAFTMQMSGICFVILQTFALLFRFLPKEAEARFHHAFTQWSMACFSIVAPSLLSVYMARATELFNRKDHFCWIRFDFKFVSLLLPSFALLIVDIFVGALIVLDRVFGWSLRREDAAENPCVSKIRTAVTTVLHQFSIITPSITQYLSMYSAVVTVWHILFTILNGSQGIILAILTFYEQFYGRLKALKEEIKKAEDENRDTTLLRRLVKHSSTIWRYLFTPQPVPPADPAGENAPDQVNGDAVAHGLSADDKTSEVELVNGDGEPIKDRRSCCCLNLPLIFTAGALAIATAVCFAVVFGFKFA